MFRVLLLLKVLNSTTDFSWYKKKNLHCYLFFSSPKGPTYLIVFAKDSNVSYKMFSNLVAETNLTPVNQELDCAYKRLPFFGKYKPLSDMVAVNLWAICTVAL